MITPPYLKKGDKIGIAATAKRTTPDEIAQGLELLAGWGLIPVPAANIYNEHHFFAGTDEERLTELQQMLDDPDIKAIIFTKGAYGTLRIADRLDLTTFLQHPKWIAGYSDITVLHNRLHNLGVKSLHTVMLQGIPGSLPIAEQTLHSVLFGEPLTYGIPAYPDNRNTPPSLNGMIVGGNLSMLHTLMGTPADIDTNGKILFIEDIDEYLYHLDRMMIALDKGGKLAGLKALVVGGMTDIKESTLPFGQSANEIILHHTRHYNYPVYFGFPAGHIKDNRAIILGDNLLISTKYNSVFFWLYS